MILTKSWWRWNRHQVLWDGKENKFILMENRGGEWDFWAEIFQLLILRITIWKCEESMKNREKNGKHCCVVINRRGFDARWGGWDGWKEVDAMCRKAQRIVEFGRSTAIGKTESLRRQCAPWAGTETNVEEFQRQISAERVCTEVDVIEKGKFQQENCRATFDTFRLCRD